MNGGREFHHSLAAVSSSQLSSCWDGNPPIFIIPKFWLVVWNIFLPYGNFIIPTDELIFREMAKNHQPAVLNDWEIVLIVVANVVIPFMG